MKSILKIIALILLPVLCRAQTDQNYPDSMQTALRNATNDTMRMDINRKLGFFNQDSDAGKALVYHGAQLALAKKLQFRIWEADAYQQIAYCYTILYNLPAGYENYMQGLKIAEDPATATNGWGYSNFSYSKSPEEARRSIIGMIHFELSTFYNLTRYYELAFKQSQQALEIGTGIQNLKIMSLATRDIGLYYLRTKRLDSAFFYLHQALSYYNISPYKKNLGGMYVYLGQYYETKKQFDSAMVSYRRGLDISLKDVSLTLQSGLQALLGNVYMQKGMFDSALLYTMNAQNVSVSVRDSLNIALNLIQLGNIYKKKQDYVQAFHYLEAGKNLFDTLTNRYIDKLMQFQNMDFDQKTKLQKLEKESQLLKSRNRSYALLGGLAILVLVGLLLYRNNRRAQKANNELASALVSLKATQSQLIQSEKMASLGELTAGIAHEIQNPLNFVNNFSEVNSELISELVEEADKGNTAEVKLIAADIKDNSEKINHHGKRADAIVKGMLQHSRSSSGVKELTDINALADEYLRLAYHGLRAKDKSFNATMKTDFDESIGNINIIPQDIGRVILNLITNAFYAVDEKKKTAAENLPTGQAGYKPTVTVQTKKINDKIEIKVEDNGNGIPQNIADKIFQPFFTTKPTGQGTGLGLSLSYDIVKAHGGELKVETKEEAGATFTLILPISL